MSKAIDEIVELMGKVIVEEWFLEQYQTVLAFLQEQTLIDIPTFEIDVTNVSQTIKEYMGDEFENIRVITVFNNTYPYKEVKMFYKGKLIESLDSELDLKESLRKAMILIDKESTVQDYINSLQEIVQISLNDIVRNGATTLTVDQLRPIVENIPQSQSVEFEKLNETMGINKYFRPIVKLDSDKNNQVNVSIMLVTLLGQEIQFTSEEMQNNVGYLASILM